MYPASTYKLTTSCLFVLTGVEGGYGELVMRYKLITSCLFVLTGVEGRVRGVGDEIYTNYLLFVCIDRS